MEKPWDLRERTILFAVSVIRFCRSLPRGAEAAEIASQLRRSSSSVGAHYVAARRNKSDADYISKLNGGIEEAEESTFWFDLLLRADITSESAAGPLRHEADQLCKILISCRSTAIQRRERAKAEKIRNKSTGKSPL
jgi:four helix bundle protein